MEQQKILTARMTQRHDTLENWNKENSIPLNGEIIIYDMPDGSRKIKIGDGKKSVQDLPFQQSENKKPEIIPKENEFLTLDNEGNFITKQANISGIGTKASDNAQLVCGKYNINDKSSNNLFIAGNGSERMRSNAFSVTQEGEVVSKAYYSANGYYCLEQDPSPKISKIDFIPLIHKNENSNYVAGAPTVTIFPNGYSEDFYLYTFCGYLYRQYPKPDIDINQILKFSSKDNSVEKLSVAFPEDTSGAIAQINPENNLIYIFTSSNKVYTFNYQTEKIQLETDFTKDLGSKSGLYSGKAVYSDGYFYIISHSEEFFKYDIYNKKLTFLQDIWQIDDSICDMRIKDHYVYIETQEEDGSESRMESFRVDLNNPTEYERMHRMGNDDGGDDVYYNQNFFYNNTIFSPSTASSTRMHYFRYILGEKTHHDSTYYYSAPTASHSEDLSEYRRYLPIATSEFSKKYNCIFAIRGDSEYIMKIYFDQPEYYRIGEVGRKFSEYNGEIFNDYTGNIASGHYSHAEGRDSIASGKYGSHAEGCYTIASGSYGSHAEGEGAIASGEASHAEGYDTIASGKYGSHAEGDDTIASGSRSHAEGNNTLAYGYGSHAEGYGDYDWTYSVTIYNINTISKTFNINDSSVQAKENDLLLLYQDGKLQYSYRIENLSYPTITIIDDKNDKIEDLIEGIYDFRLQSNGIAEGEYSHSEGHKTIAKGNNSHAEGKSSNADGDFSHTEGTKTHTIGKNSHAEGYSTTAEGQASHSEGVKTHSYGQGSHAEGGFREENGIDELPPKVVPTAESGLAEEITIDGPLAYGVNAHAENTQTFAQGYSSHAEGQQTYAKGPNSHAEGQATIATGKCQHVEGCYNIEDNEKKYIHIVGNGTIITDSVGITEKNPSNAHTLDWNGNAWYQGNLKIGGQNYDDPNAIDLTSLNSKINEFLQGNLILNGGSSSINV